MILSFRNSATEDIAFGIASKSSRRLLPIELHKKARRWIAVLDAARSLAGLWSPGLRLEKLKKDRSGQYSIRINDQYRICFVWRENAAWDVEIVDYH